MAQPGLKNQTDPEIEETSLKGTLVSVFIVGAIIVAFWVGVYNVFLDRF